MHYPKPSNRYRVADHYKDGLVQQKWVSEWLLFNANSAIFQLWREQVNFQWDDDEVCIVLDQHAELDSYSVSSLKQQSVNRHVARHYPDSQPTSICSFS
jgi:hypothetical protein